MKMYIIFFLGWLAGIELTGFALRLIRNDLTFTSLSFYLGDITSHLINIVYALFICSIFYFNKAKIYASSRGRFTRVINTVSIIYFSFILLLLLRALISTDVVKRLAMEKLVTGCVLVSITIIIFNIFIMFKDRNNSAP